MRTKGKFYFNRSMKKIVSLGIPVADPETAVIIATQCQ